ncbi:MAG: hypothetical protein P1U68_04800 [Verrucomicrobiales bacterium]|nr:hypothetical protein [Verrucomicrobiales bacterium]
MKPGFHLFTIALYAIGFTAVAFSSVTLSQSGTLDPGDNPFALKQSAYGRLLARLSETTVDRVWHLGVEQIVPHYMSGTEAHTEAATKHISEPTTEPAIEATTASKEAPSKPMIELAKGWVQKRVVSQYTRTNPHGMTEKHITSINRGIADMLKRSYDLDPTHYGAYNSYSLFITHQTYGGSKEGRKAAKRLAKETIDHIKNETEDPEAYLTAASASMNLFILETEDARMSGAKIPLKTLKHFRDQTAFLLGRFENLQEKAEETGTWDALSFERQVEIAQRHRFTRKTSEQFQAMITRAEDRLESESKAEIVENID